jgi:hypothetical protein
VSESQQELEHLDLGESEAISLALRVSADLVLRTSGEAGQVARHRGLGVSRTLGERVITDAGVVIMRLADLDGAAHGYSQPGRITILESLTRADTSRGARPRVPTQTPSPAWRRSTDVQDRARNRS